MILMVKIIPNAHRNEWVGFEGKILKLRIQAPPDKGKANEEMIAFLSEKLSIPKARIQILSGHSSRLKKIEIDADVEILHTLTAIK